MVEIEPGGRTPTKSRQIMDPSRPSSIVAGISSYLHCMNSTRMMVLLVLCLQNSMFTLLRRYSLGVLHESYSKHEVLMFAEVIKMTYSAWMISKDLGEGVVLQDRLIYLVETSRKMLVLALIYGAMNILSFVALRNISAGMFTIFAQCKILTTATFSTILLRRAYSWTQWRALLALMFGVLLFSEPIWGNPEKQRSIDGGNAFFGSMAVLTEVTLSGFASIYFEKVIKTDALKLTIWERNFQLALGSFPVYIVFIILDAGGEVGFMGGWSFLALLLTVLGAAGGLLVALSIKYGDSILKTLATTSAIILSSVLDYMFLGGPLTPIMIIAGGVVILAICDYTFDATPSPSPSSSSETTTTTSFKNEDPTAKKHATKLSESIKSKGSSSVVEEDDDEEEGVPLVSSRTHSHGSEGGVPLISRTRSHSSDSGSIIA